MDIFVSDAQPWDQMDPRFRNSAIPANTNTAIKQYAKITPFLWFNGNAEEAVKFYTSIFKNSKIGRILRYDEETAKVSQSGRPAGSVLTIEFEIEGQKFVALNGGLQFKFNESISFVVNAKRRRKSIIFGRNSLLMAVKSPSAVGSRTNSACRGRSPRPC
jgi:hypothetical protein